MARLEYSGAGDYFWIPFAQIETIVTERPERLRDLLWFARVTGAGFQQRELGEILIPALSRSLSATPMLKCGWARSPVAADEQGNEQPYGLKMI